MFASRIKVFITHQLKHIESVEQGRTIDIRIFIKICFMERSLKLDRYQWLQYLNAPVLQCFLFLGNLRKSDKCFLWQLHGEDRFKICIFWVFLNLFGRKKMQVRSLSSLNFKIFEGKKFKLLGSLNFEPHCIK